MLQNIREHAQGWIATVIAVMLSIAFALWGIEYYLNSGSKKDLVAKVNGTEITNRQLNFDFQRLNIRLVEQLGSQVLLNTAFQESVKKQALQNIITREVLIQAAIHAGFLIGMSHISAAIQQIPEFQNQGQFSMDRFRDTVSRLGYSQAAFIEDLKQTILLNQVTSGIIGSEFSLNNEVDDAIVREQQKRNIFYTIIPATRFAKTVIPTKQEIESYYQTHRNDFIIPAKVTLEYVELTTADVKKSIKVPEAELKEYYQISFAQKHTTFEKEKAKIEQTLLQQKMEQAFSNQNDKIADLAFTNPNTLDPIAQTLGLKIKTTEAFSHQGGTTSVTKNPKVIATAFNQEAINTRTNSSTIEVSPGDIVVVRVKDYQSEGVQPLSAVENKIIENLKLDLAKAKTQQFGEQMVNAVKQQTNYLTYLKNQHMVPIEKNKIGRENKDIPLQILQAAFSVPASQDLNKPSMTGVSLTNGDYAVIGVSKLVSFTKSEIVQKMQDKYQKLLADNYGKLAYTLYLHNKLQDAKVKYYNQ